MQMKLEDVTEKGIVTLYASAFGNLDAHRDIIEQGAYSKTIKELGPSGKNRIKHLWQHWGDTIIGKPLSMTEDSKGLRIDSFVSDINGGDYRKMYRDGLITEHSVGIIPMKEEYSKEDDINIIKEAKMLEYSAVTWGANEETPVVDVKSMTPEQFNAKVERAKANMDRLSKALYGGNFTDDTMVKIQIMFEQAKAELFSLLDSREPLSKGTHGEQEPTPIDWVKVFNEL